MRRTRDADGQRPLFDDASIPKRRDRRGDETALINYIEIYCQRLRNHSKPDSDYPDNVQKVLQRFVEYTGLHDARLRDVQSLDVEEYLERRKKDKWRGKQLSPITLNNEIGYLNTAFNFAGPKDKYRNGRKHLNWIAEPPYCEKLTAPDVPPVELTDEQIQNFIRATKHARTPRIAGCSPADFWLSVLILDSLTLLRRKALLKVLRPDDETLFEKKRLFIPADINKTSENVFVTLGTDDRIPKLFAKLPTKPGEPILPWRRKNGKPMGIGYFSQHMKDFQRAAGIPDSERLKLKQLRSTSANKVEDLSDELTAKSKLKHAPGTNTYRKHYRVRHPKPKEIEATDGIKDWLLGVIAETKETETTPFKVVG